MTYRHFAYWLPISEREQPVTSEMDYFARQAAMVRYNDINIAAREMFAALPDEVAAASAIRSANTFYLYHQIDRVANGCES